jgi:hypothetical protein
LANWTEKDREQGLKALVISNGNTEKAAEALKASGKAIPGRTLRDWRQEHAERYETLEKSRNDWMAAFLSDHAEFIGTLAGEVEIRLLLNALNRSDEELNGMDLKKLTDAAKNATVVRSMSIQRANELRQRPTKPIGEVMSFAEATKALAAFMRKHPGIVETNLIEGTAEEVKES